MKSLIFIIFYICFFSSKVGAQTQVRAYIKPHVVQPQSLFTLTVEIEYQSAQNIQPPRLPPLNDFHLMGQNLGSYFSLTGKTVTRKKSYHYKLKSLKEGQFKIGSVQVIVDGKVYKTSPVKVEVSSQAKPQAKPHGRSSPFHSPFGNMKKFFPPGFFAPGFLDDKDMFPSKGAIKEKDVLFQLEVNKDTVYLGEMITAEWFIYIPHHRVQSVQTIRSQVTKPAKLDGFWVESITAPGETPSVSPKLVERNGKKYQKELIISSALFPIQEGPLTIEPVEIKTVIFGSSSVRFLKPLVHVSKKKQITVLPLPQEGKGQFWTEAVGDFNISALVNKKIVRVQEPVVYKVSFKGEGQVGPIRLPDLNFGEAFEVYDITESQKFAFSQSTKDFEVILIPKISGDLIIPSFELSTFDPHLGIYKTHVLPSFTLKALGKALSNGLADQNKIYFEPQKKSTPEGEEKGISIIPLAQGQEFFVLKHRKMFWGIIYGLLFLSFVWGVIRLCFSQKDKNSFKKQLKANLKKVDQAMADKNWKKSGIELNQLMYFFFSEWSKQNQSAKNWDILLKHINPSIRVKYESKIKDLVSRIEQLSFAKEGSVRALRSKKNVESLKKEVIDLVQEISAEYFA